MSSNEWLDTRCSPTRQPSIAPEAPQQVAWWQLFFSMRVQQMPMELIHYNLLFRWFVSLPMNAEVHLLMVLIHTATGRKKCSDLRQSWSAPGHR